MGHGERHAERLAARGLRLELVMRMLCERAEARRRSGAAVPPPLSAAVDGFAAELRDVRARLRRLERGAPAHPAGLR